VAVTGCRFCGGALSIPFCDLGAMPVANRYVSPEMAGTPDPVFPLNAVVCERCFLVQLDLVVDATSIFSDYAYLSSVSATWLAHAAAFAADMIVRMDLGPGRFVVEVASNDGYLLRNFVAAGVPCLGIEPAGNVAAIAETAGVPTQVAFFGRAVASALMERRGHADLVVANNVLAHVPDVNDFVAGLAVLAGEHGIVSIECPHVLNLIEQVQFDTIYHEHYAYWSLGSLRQVLAAHGLAVFAVELVPTHGGSLRVLAAASAPPWGPSALDAILAAERAAGLGSAEAYNGFGRKVRAVVDPFRDYLDRARAGGRRIGAYGAAAKGTTFLNASRTTPADITVVADRNLLKQGRFLPGCRIPVTSVQGLVDARPDEVVILPWNIADEIADELRGLKGWSAKLLTAVPRLRTVA
jgi:hypothetical protein